MRKSLGFLAVLAACVSLVSTLRAQAVYTASKTIYLQGGAGVFYLHPDYLNQYGNNTVEGVSGWADANLINFLGIEAETHISVVDSSDRKENTYLIGPRVGLKKGKGNFYGKAMVGRGAFIFDANVPPGAKKTKDYTLYAFGGGLDYRISQSFNYRVVDAEFQTWSGFKPHGLSPYVISTGIMFIVH